jgi:HK97 family phage major capsid protein
MTKHVRAAALLSGVAIPRAIKAGVRNDGGGAAEVLSELNKTIGTLTGDFKKQFADLEKAVSDFRAANDEALAKKADVVLTEKVDKINSAIDENKDKLTQTQAQIEAISKEVTKLVEKMATASVTGPSGRKGDPRTAGPDYPAYAKAWETYFRHGETAVPGGEHALRQLEVKAAMTVGSNPDGGYTALPEIEQGIDEVLKEVSPMRGLATVRQISAAEYKKLVNLHGTASGWVGETDSRPQTAGANLTELKFPAMELYAMPAASQSLLDDSFLDIGAWLGDEVQLEFANQEGVAFISGDGVLKPAGFIGGYPIVANASYAWGKIGYVATGAAGAFKTDGTPTAPADCLIDIYTSLKTAYRKNSTFIANRTTLGAIRKLKDANGVYLLAPVMSNGGFIEEILGRPSVEMPDMPDIAANSYSVACGDFRRGYLVVDRVGIRVLRDPYTAKPYVLFYTTKRVGGGVQNFEAIKLLKFAAS